MDPRVLDVLHHRANHHALAVRERVDVGLIGVLEKPIDEHRPVLAHARGALEVVAQRRLIVHDLHGAAAEHVRRAHEARVADVRRALHRLLDARRGAVRRLRQPELARDLLEPAPVLGDVDRVGRRAEDRNAGCFERARELERRLPAELHDHADRLLAVHDLEHVLERERLEVQLVRRVEVGRDGLGVRVDHDRLVAPLPERDHRAHTAVVELDALADSVRARAEDHDRRAAAARRLVLLVVAAVQVRRRRRELARARVDHLVRRADA